MVLFNSLDIVLGLLPISSVSYYYYFKKYFNYKKYNIKDIEYLDTLEEVIEKYYKSGGREITEAEINKTDFNKLPDKDWVLYGDN